MLPIYQKNGKSFVIIEGKEHEVEAPAAPAAVAAVASVVASTVAAIDPVKMKANNIAEERAYRNNFVTAMKTAGIEGAKAEEFETKFYGRPIDDVKFLASNAIGARATAVGEGAGDSTKTEEQKKAEALVESEKKFVADLTVRWHSDTGLRRLHGVNITNAAHPLYVSRLNRYIAAEKKCRDDEATKSGDRILDDKQDESDAISRLMKNKNVFVKA